MGNPTGDASIDKNKTHANAIHRTNSISRKRRMSSDNHGISITISKNNNNNNNNNKDGAIASEYDDKRSSREQQQQQQHQLYNSQSRNNNKTFRTRIFVVVNALAIALSILATYEFVLVGSDTEYHKPPKIRNHQNANTPVTTSPEDAAANAATTAVAATTTKSPVVVLPSSNNNIDNINIDNISKNNPNNNNQEDGLLDFEFDDDTYTSAPTTTASSSSPPPTTAEPTTAESSTEEPTSLMTREQEPANRNNNNTPTKDLQVRNFNDGSALLLNVHAVHHGGTTFCQTIGRAAGAPDFACMGDTLNKMPVPPRLCDKATDPECYSLQDMLGSQKPWQKAQTGIFVDRILPFFGMVSWEIRGENYRLEYNGRGLHQTDWEHPFLVSVVVVRDPIARLLAGDGSLEAAYPGFSQSELGRADWWDYAAYDGRYQTDNVFLRMLLSKNAPLRKNPGSNNNNNNNNNHVREGLERTTDQVLELFPTDLDESDFLEAKALLDRFTFVLDIACLDEGMEALGGLLGLDLADQQQQQGPPPRPSDRDRIGFDDVYEYLVEKNRWDIALYEYSKTISLVRCEGVRDDEDARLRRHR